jgi:hypothetical protein
MRHRRSTLLRPSSPRVLVFWIATFTTPNAVQARLLLPRGPWSLPPIQSTGSGSDHFVQECESLWAFVEKFRGGATFSDDYPASRPSSSYGRSGDFCNDRYASAPVNRYTDDDAAYYDDRGTDDWESARRPRPPSGPSITRLIQHGDRKVGLTLLASGIMVTMLGISLFFNKTLMRLGNLLFIAGVPVTLGPSRTMGYFLQPQKTRATVCLVLGILLVFFGHPVFGMVLEAFGLLNLFGNMFPLLMAVVKQMPIVGNLMKQSRSGTTSRRPAAPPSRDPYDYDHPPRDNEDDYRRDYDDNDSRRFY